MTIHSKTTVSDIRQKVEEFTRRIDATPAGSNQIGLYNFQWDPDYSGWPSDDVVTAINYHCKQIPFISVRIYGAWQQTEVDLQVLSKLTNLRHLNLELHCDRLKNFNALRNMTQLRRLRLEIGSPDSFRDLESLQNLEELRLERPPGGSKRPDVSVIASLPRLRKLFILGYPKGIEAVSRCAALRHVQIQQMKVESWNILPPHRLDFACFSFLKGPEGLKNLQVKAEKFHIVGMKPEKPMSVDELFSQPEEFGNNVSMQLNIDNANTLFETPDCNGHTWCRYLQGKMGEKHAALSFDAEADGCTVIGKKRALQNFRKTVATAMNQEAISPQQHG